MALPLFPGVRHDPLEAFGPHQSRSLHFTDL